MTWLVTPPGQALPPAGTVTDNGPQPPGLSMMIPEEWGADPAGWPPDWFALLPTTEAFRYTREPVDVLPPFEERPLGVTGWRLTLAGAFYPYARSVTYSGATTLRLSGQPALGQTGLRLTLAGAVAP